MTPDLAALITAAHDRIMTEVVGPLESEIAALREENARSREVVASLKALSLRLGLPRRACS